MIFFALVMLAASISMIRDKKAPDKQLAGPLNFNLPVIALNGALVVVF